MNRKIASHTSIESAIRLGPAPAGNLAIPVFSHGNMEAELYIPGETDRQSPHARDEIYIVSKGSGEFFDGEKLIAIQAGSFIFVPAGTEHRFENYTDDLTLWVIFYGPEGGE